MSDANERKAAIERARLLYDSGRGKSLRALASEPGIAGVLSHDALKRASSAGNWAIGKTRPIRLDLEAVSDSPAELAIAVVAAIRAVLSDPGKARVGDLIEAAEYLSARAAADTSTATDMSRLSQSERDGLRALLAIAAGQEPWEPEYPHSPLSRALARVKELEAERSTDALEQAHAATQAAEDRARAAEHRAHALEHELLEHRARAARIDGMVAIATWPSEPASNKTIRESPAPIHDAGPSRKAT